MDTPSGTIPARVTEHVTRNHTTPVVLRSTLAILVVALAAGAASCATAQDEISPEPAIIEPIAPRALALDAFAIDGKLVVVGERGHILISTDVGATWRQVEVPTRAMLTGVFFYDENLGWAVGHDSVILRTTDGGTTWELVNWAPEEEAPFFDVWFPDADNGFAIGAYGTFMVTSDGGESWDFESISDDDWHLNKIGASTGGRLFIAAEAGMVYRSDDGGATWEQLPSPYEGSFFGVLPLEGDTVLLFGLRGHLLRSEDAGESWREIETGTMAMLTDGVTLDDGTIVIVGLGGTVLVSSDGGLTFESHPQSNRRGISAVVQASDDTVLIVGEFGVMTLPTSSLRGNGLSGGTQP
jgi:photosystem II stability/assembly factor-like uncharacterized protein